jgi:methionyl-tRNA formyltransferase
MKVAFAGTPEFAARSLAALLAAGHQVTLTLTQPDRPAGRGLKAQASAVKHLAKLHGLQVMQPTTLKDPEVLDALRAAGPEAIVVAAYGLLLPPALLRLAPRGCLNVHASLLPRWRGAAPIQRALLAGDTVTGMTIMQMDEGLDTGPVLLQASIPISAEDTAGTLHDRLAALGAAMIVRALETQPTPRPQGEGATYAPRITKAETRVDWTKSAVEIERELRAFHPAPGAQARLDAISLKLWRAAIEPGVCAEPGRVCAADPSGIVVACGTDALRITELQRAGGKRLGAEAFLAGWRVRPGMRFDAGHG